MAFTVPAHLAAIETELHRQTRQRALYSFLTIAGLIGFMIVGFEAADEANAGGFLQGFNQLLDFPLELFRLSFEAGWNWFPLLLKYLPALMETIHMAMLATFIGFIGAVAVSLLASQNLVKSKLAVATMRRFMDLSRAFPELVLAMVLLFLMGKSAVPALIAIAFHTIGALGKLFSEANENADMRPVEGLTATGANWFQQVRYGVIPQVLPNYLSYGLLRLEINVRASTILGFVGAGGIGEQLTANIQWTYGAAVTAIFVLLITTIVALDYLSRWARSRLIGANSTVEG
ncbi:MAG: phosphonate ABC transporter, permease protein PhnE [Proteobacteria bacterium]|nr:phosphonate ABC transporter, permease protein PhnE [Pseudomonadota bacterium]MDA1309168.1 phosphonate ABC transporter, permease protein PhnE [Pseudomonadota bacterium]